MSTTTTNNKRKRDSNDKGGNPRQQPGPVVSYGVLLYKQRPVAVDADKNDSIQFLLGLIPQRNWWTVFKGLPEPGESPEKTAWREFQEETGWRPEAGNIPTALQTNPLTTLHGRVGNKKRLEIFLYEGGSFFDNVEQHFCLERVVKIDSGYMKGKPEIVAVQWLTLHEALTGTNNAGGAMIYKSQQNILKDAHEILMRKFAKDNEQESKERDTSDK